MSSCDKVRRPVGWLPGGCGLLLVFLVGCGGPAPCDFCRADEACYQDRCYAIKPCTSGADCQPGHRCSSYRSTAELFPGDVGLPDLSARDLAGGGGPVDMGGQAAGMDGSTGLDGGAGLDGGSDLAADGGGETKACSFVCDSPSCPTGTECLGSGLDAQCLPVECGQVVRCAGPQLCDLFANKCYPFNGSCRVDADCPKFDNRPPPGVTTSCLDGFCRVQRSADTVPELPPDAQVQIYSPARLQVFPSAADVEFRWSSQEASVIVYVLTGLPSRLTDLPRLAIWGLAYPPGHAPSARSEDGAAIENGTWLNMTRSLPENTLLYLFVQAVAPEKLVAASELVPFRIGTPWPFARPNDLCDRTCTNMESPLICSAGRCQLICGSNRDCAPFGLVCGDLVTSSGVNQRLCQ